VLASLIKKFWYPFTTRRKYINLSSVLTTGVLVDSVAAIRCALVSTRVGGVEGNSVASRRVRLSTGFTSSVSFDSIVYFVGGENG